MKQYNVPVLAYILCLLTAIIGCLFICSGIIDGFHIQVTAHNDTALDRLLNKGLTVTFAGEAAPWPAILLIGIFLLAISGTMFALVHKKCA